MHDLVIGLCIHGDPLRVALSQEVSTCEAPVKHFLSSTHWKKALCTLSSVRVKRNTRQGLTH